MARFRECRRIWPRVRFGLIIFERNPAVVFAAGFGNLGRVHERIGACLDPFCFKWRGFCDGGIWEKGTEEAVTEDV